MSPGDQTADSDELMNDSHDDGPALREPMWDEEDGASRCTDCAWEVIGGQCQGCGERFVHDKVSTTFWETELMLLISKGYASSLA